MGWLSNWQYRKKITIQGQSGAGTDYQVLLKVGESSGASGYDFHVEGHSSNFPSSKNQSGELRFTKSDGTTLLNFWVEKVEGTSPNRVAYCWVKITDNLDSNVDIYCYYGNSSATNVSNGDDTFLFFDDFDDNTIDSSKWTIVSGTWEETNDYIHYTGNLDEAFIRSSYTGTDYMIMSRIALESTSKNANIFARYSDINNLYLLQWMDSDEWQIWKRVNGNWTKLTYISLAEDTDWHVWKFAIHGNDLKAWLDDANEISTSDTNFSSGYAGYRVGSVSPVFKADWIAVRKYISPEPSFSSASGEEKEVTETYAINVLLQNLENKNYNIDLLVKKILDKNYDISTLLQKIIYKNYNISSLLQELISKNYDIDLLTRILKNYNYNIDILLETLLSYNIDILLKKLKDKDYSIISLLYKLKSQNYSISSLLRELISKDHDIDLLIQQLNIFSDYLINALFQITKSYSYNLEISLFDINYVFFDDMKLQLVWNDEFNNSEIDAIKRLTLAQNYNIQEFNVCEKPITLEATENQGWLTRKQVEILYEKASVPNKTYPLIYNGKCYLVRFRWEDPPVIDVTPILPRPNMADDDYYYGTIKLMQILK